MSDTPPHASNGREHTPDLTSRREKRPRDAVEEDDRDRHGSARRKHREDYANDEEYERDRERRHRQREREREEDPEREERRRRRHHDDETEEEREERRRRRREREREREMRDGGDRDREDPNHERGDRYREREREREPRSERGDRGGYRGRELIDDTPRSASGGGAVGGREREREHDLPERPRRESRTRDRSRDSHRSHRSRDVRDDSAARPQLPREEREAERERRDREMQEERRERARRDAHFEEMDRERRGDRRRSMPRDYSPARRMRGSPSYDERGSPRRGGGPPPPPPPPPRELDPAEALIQSFDSENRSIFISQLATRLTSQDLGLFFEDKLGRGAVRDARVVTDRGSKRSKGIGYVELDDVSLVNKALALSGTIVMGIPIVIQLTEAEKNHEGKTAAQLAAEATRFLSGPSRGPREPREQAIQFPPLSTGLRLPPGFDPQAHQEASVPYYRLFVTGLAYTLNEQDIAAVFEPFGQVELIDLHKDHAGSSKGSAYVQYQNLRGAQMALDAMNGFELAGRPIRVQTIQERSQISEHLEDSGYGPKMDAKQRQQLMYKLARTEQEQAPGQAPAARAPPPRQQNAEIRPTPFLVVGNMFNPEEENQPNWDLDLAEDVKGEVERQYGQVKRIKVDKLSAGEVYMEFPDADTADRAFRGLGGRFFGGRQLSASFISEALFKAHM